jgi:hypothetical protein
LLIAAGLLGWTAVLDPIAALRPGQASAALTPARTAIFALAVLIGVKCSCDRDGGDRPDELTALAQPTRGFHRPKPRIFVVCRAIKAREAPVVATGTLAFLFTDIAGSTRLWETLPVAMAGALARHDEILRDAIGAPRARSSRRPATA